MSSYKVDEVYAGMLNLNHLLSVICDIQFDLDREKKDERIDSLLWIARDLSDGIIEKHHEETAAKLAEHRRAKA